MAHVGLLGWDLISNTLFWFNADFRVGHLRQYDGWRQHASGYLRGPEEACDYRY